MSLALDTSVVVRLLVGEPAAQHRAARERIQRAHAEAEPVVVTDLVVVESYFALRHHYGVPDGEARQQLAAFLRSGVVDADPPGMADVLAEGSPPELPDRLIHHRHGRLEATTLTFDHAFARLPDVERP